MCLPVHTSHPCPHGIQSRPLATHISESPPQTSSHLSGGWHLQGGEAFQLQRDCSSFCLLFATCRISPSEGMLRTSLSWTWRCLGPLSTQSTHLPWINILEKEGGLGPLNMPLLADVTISLSQNYGVQKEDEGISYQASLLSLARVPFTRSLSMICLWVPCTKLWGWSSPSRTQMTMGKSVLLDRSQAVAQSSTTWSTASNTSPNTTRLTGGELRL